MRQIKAMLAFLTLLSGMLYGQTNHIKMDPNLEIYLLMGQSNMAGRGKITDDYISVSDPRVVMLNKANNWVTATHPIHFDKPVAGVGPGLAFGITIANGNPGKKIGLIPCAVGGTSINKWLPGAFDSATNTHPWDDAVKRIKNGMKHGVIKGVIWHQGESDSNPDSAKVYMDRLVTLIERIRKEVNNEKLPFVAGELGRYKPNYQLINDIIIGLPEKVPYTAVVSSNELVHNGDVTHFDSVSADELGKRYAKAMLLLTK